MSDPAAATTTTADPAASTAPASATTAPAATGSVLDGKTAATPAAAATEPAKPAAPAVPEKYEFVKPKEGAMVPDDEAELVAEAKALGLTQEQAQKFYDARLASHKATNEAIAQQQAQIRSEWMKDIMADPNYGGAKFEASKMNANRLISQAGEEGKAFAALLAKEGLDAEPTLFRFLAKIGSRTGEGSWLTGDTTPQKPQTGGAFDAKKDASLFFGKT